MKPKASRSSERLSSERERNQRLSGRYPFWLWPNLVGLDAPAVAVVWQRFLGSQFKVDVPVSASVVLGLVVWGVYLIDRFLDARSGAEEADRHRFTRSQGLWPGLFGASLFAAAGILAATALPSEYIRAGLCVAAGLGVYLVAAHTRPILGGKEALVGLVFALGVAVPLFAEKLEDWKSWSPSVAGFAPACFLNCRLIAKWEGAAIPRWEGYGLLSAVALSAACCPLQIGWVLVGCAAAMLILDASGSSVRVRRVLVDAVLLAPAFL